MIGSAIEVTFLVYSELYSELNKGRN
jgi:hypothetical protein